MYVCAFDVFINALPLKKYIKKTNTSSSNASNIVIYKIKKMFKKINI